MKFTAIMKTTEANEVSVSGSVECQEIEKLEVDIFANNGFECNAGDELVSVTVETSDPLDLARFGAQFPNRLPKILEA